MTAKQPNKVRGNVIGCINYSMCPICYGCKSYDSRFEECRECYELGIDGSSRNYNVCNNNLHESWKINKMITKHEIKFDELEIKNREADGFMNLNESNGIYLNEELGFVPNKKEIEKEGDKKQDEKKKNKKDKGNGKNKTHKNRSR